MGKNTIKSLGRDWSSLATGLAAAKISLIVQLGDYTSKMSMERNEEKIVYLH